MRIDIRLKCVLCGLLLTGLLSSCAKTAQTQEVVLGDRDTVAMTEDGFFMRAWFGGQMLFYDFKTESIVPLCSKPDCPHTENSDCSAYVQEGYVDGFFVYGDHIYYFISQSYDSMMILRSDLDGSNRTKVAVDDELSSVFRYIGIDNKIYYWGVVYKIDEKTNEITERCTVVKCLELDTENISYVLNGEKRSQDNYYMLGADRENIFYLYMSLTPNEEDDTHTRNECSFKRISLETGEETLIRDSKDCIYEAYNETGIYFITQNDEMEYEAWHIGYDDGQPERLFQAAYRFSFLVTRDDRIICCRSTEEGDWDLTECMMWNRRTGSSTEFRFEDASLTWLKLLGEHDDFYIADLTFDDGTVKRVKLDKDSLYQGKLDYTLILENT